MSNPTPEVVRVADEVGPAECSARPRILDLFCGAGGAAMGYYRAGFDVLGIDIDPQPNYPFECLQGDALELGPEVFDFWHFDAVHASPPCQSWTAYNRRPNHVANRPRHIHAVREWMEFLCVPTVIENVAGAPLEQPVRLCGSSFGLDVRRHRFFELSGVTVDEPPCDHAWQTPRFPPATNRTNLRSTVEVGVWRIPLDVQQRAMGIDWMTLPELSEAIPPAYTEHIGAALREAVATRRAA